MKAVTQPRAFETREKILQAAARLFALKGYHDTKLEEVLEPPSVEGRVLPPIPRPRRPGLRGAGLAHEHRRQLLDAIEQELPLAKQADPLQQVFRRLDAIQEMVRRREGCKGGCIIGNLSTALSDCHDGFRKRLAECFDEMAAGFLPTWRRRLGNAGAGGGRIPASWPGTSSASSKGRSCRPGPSATAELLPRQLACLERAPEEMPGTVKLRDFFRV